MAREAAKEWAGNYENGVIGFGNKQTSVHFQVADLIAYEIRKHVENAIYKQGGPLTWKQTDQSRSSHKGHRRIKGRF
jgi:hypothetical protein